MLEQCRRVRGIFREAFEAVGLKYHSPHSVRKTLARYGQKLGLSIRAYKAWSKNLGRSNMMTIFSSNGDVSPEEQAELIRGLGQPQESDDIIHSPEVKLLLSI